MGSAEQGEIDYRFRNPRAAVDECITISKDKSPETPSEPMDKQETAYIVVEDGDNTKSTIGCGWSDILPR